MNITLLEFLATTGALLVISLLFTMLACGKTALRLAWQAAPGHDRRPTPRSRISRLFLAAAKCAFWNALTWPLWVWFIAWLLEAMR